MIAKPHIAPPLLNRCAVPDVVYYLTIRLRARNFYRFIELRASNLIVLVKTNLCLLFLQNYFKKRGISIVFLRKTRHCRVTRYLLTNRYE